MARTAYRPEVGGNRCCAALKMRWQQQKNERTVFDQYGAAFVQPGQNPVTVSIPFKSGFTKRKPIVHAR